MIQEALGVIGRSRDFEDIMKILHTNMITTPDDLMVPSGGERVIRAAGMEAQSAGTRSDERLHAPSALGRRC